MWATSIRALADADASCGAKAWGLARLFAAGLPVPDGFVIGPGVFREIAALAELSPDAIGEPESRELGPAWPARREPAAAGSIDDVDRRPGTAPPAGPGSYPVRAIAEVDHPVGALPAELGAFPVGWIGHALAVAGQRIAEVALPVELEREVRDRARALGRLAVRSSASIEDGELGSGAGVFASVIDIAPEDVWGAVRAVWTSALTPLAVAYARRRAAAIDLTGTAVRSARGPALPIDLTPRSTSSIAMSVIVQRFVPGTRLTVYTRPAGSPRGDELWLARGGDAENAGPVERIARAASTDHREAALAVQAEAAIGAASGADVELVQEPSAARTWIVQARPIIHPVRRERPAPPPILLAPLVQDGRRWTWDIAHNPDPLSPAQAGLVDRVDRAACAPYALRVCGGYLYTTPRGNHAAGVAAPADRAELVARTAAICARFVIGEPDALAEAIERYVAFMAIWAGELSPLVLAARRKLPDQLARGGYTPEKIPGLVAALIGRRPVLRDPVMSPAWDVAVPTFAERAGKSEVDRGAKPTREAPVEPVPAVRVPPVVPPMSPMSPMSPISPISSDDVELARAAAEAGEVDDLWFARAQWMVRRALLAHGAVLALRDDDIFWLPLDEALTLRSADPNLADDVHRRASAARAAHARASTWDMPLVVHGIALSEAPLAEPSMALRGVGLGPRVIGRVVRFASLANATQVGPGDVVVTRAITPALAMLVEGCAALVSETGGLLDHGAALARELGITCVVGCTGAWAQLSDGAVISVDGDAGVVGLAPLAITTRTTTAT